MLEGRERVHTCVCRITLVKRTKKPIQFHEGKRGLKGNKFLNKDVGIAVEMGI